MNKKIMCTILAIAMIFTTMSTVVFANGEQIISENIIATGDGQSALEITEDTTIIIDNDVTLQGAKGGAGIYVKEGVTLTITGSGTLTAIGHGGEDDNAKGAAGIGGTAENGDSGNIVIDGVTIYAYGYGKHGAGIGSGYGGVSGSITIKNGAVVTAQGGHYAEGGIITTSWGSGDPEGGAGIGGGSARADKIIGDIIIEDSTVVANGGSKAAGIGAGYHTGCGQIKITNSTVTANGGTSSAGIGTSRTNREVNHPKASTAEIIIENSTVTAVGGDCGAGVGTGFDTKKAGYGVTSITVADSTVNATGGRGGAGIGGGFAHNNVKVDIKNSKIMASAGEAMPYDLLGYFPNDEDRTGNDIGGGANEGNPDLSVKDDVVSVTESYVNDYYAKADGNIIKGSFNSGIYASKITDADNPERYRERFGIELNTVKADESVVIKIYADEELLATTTLRESDRDDETIKYIPRNAGLTVNVVVAGRLAGAWDTVWEKNLTVDELPTTLELWVDGILVDTRDAFGSDTNKADYIALPSVADGSEAKPYIINNIDELKAFRDDVNAGNSYKDKYVKLNADIDLANEEWTPIGNSENKFQGIFDGGDNTISNLSITGNNSYVGLFGYTTNGEVKNLTVNNAKVSGYLGVGVIAGSPYTSDYTNIKVTGHIEVNGFAYVGGMFGKNLYADATNLVMSADDTSYVKADSVKNGTAYRNYVGGIVGFMGEGSHTVSNVTSNIDVIGSTKDVGGITGIAHYNNTFSNCVSSGDVTITNSDELKLEIGGIAGVWHNQTGTSVNFENCFHTGTLSFTYNDIVYDGEFPNRGLYGSAYSSTGEGTLEEETAKIAVVFDYNGGVDSNNYTESVILAELEQSINAPTDIKKDGCAFVGWSPEFSPVVTAPVTYTAQWASLTDFKAEVAANPDEIDPKGSFIADVIVSGGDWNQARMTITYDKELFTWNNLYDSNIEEIEDDAEGNGNIVITVYGKDRIDGKVAEKLSFTAKAAEGLTHFTGEIGFVKAVIGTGDEAITLDERNTKNLVADEVTIVQTFKMTLGEGLSGNSTANTNEDYVGTITDYINDEDYEYVVKGKSGDADVTATVDGDKFTLAKKDIKGDTVLELTRKLKGIEADDIVITEYVAGHSLIVLTADSSKNYTYNGAKMYVTKYYDKDTEDNKTAYAYLVKGEVTKEEALLKLGLTTDALTEIRTADNDVNGTGKLDLYDVNGTGKLDLNDVQATWNFYNVYDRYDVYTYMDKYLNADVNNDMKVNAADIADVFDAYKMAQNN